MPSTCYLVTVFLQVTWCLAGLAAHTATWATSVGNERGEVLTTVITTSESLDALEPVASGLVGRYQHAGRERPVVLYTDRDCCVTGTANSSPAALRRLARPRHQTRRLTLHASVRAGCHLRVPPVVRQLHEPTGGLPLRVRRGGRSASREGQAQGAGGLRRKAPIDRAILLAVTKEAGSLLPSPHCRRDADGRKHGDPPSGPQNRHRHPRDAAAKTGDRGYLGGAAAAPEVTTGSRGC